MLSNNIGRFASDYVETSQQQHRLLWRSIPYAADEIYGHSIKFPIPQAKALGGPELLT
jgi:hypothetical protein